MIETNESNERDRQLWDVCKYARRLGSPLIIVLMTNAKKPGWRGVRLFGRSGPVGEVLGHHRLESGKIRVVSRFHVCDVEKALGRRAFTLAS